MIAKLLRVSAGRCHDLFLPVKTLMAMVASIVGLVACPPACAASVYKCTDSDGHTVYSGTSCGTNAAAQQIDAPPPISGGARTRSALGPPGSQLPDSRPTMAQTMSSEIENGCAREEFTAWLRGQHPAPDAAARMSKLLEFLNQCRRTSNPPHPGPEGLAASAVLNQPSAPQPDQVGQPGLSSGDASPASLATLATPDLADPSSPPALRQPPWSPNSPSSTALKLVQRLYVLAFLGLLVLSSLGSGQARKLELIRLAERKGIYIPSLWRPIYAWAWTFFLLPVMGAVLLARNWEALEEPEKARGVKMWLVLYFLLIPLGFFIPFWLGAILSVLFHVAWLLVCTGQSRYIKAKYGADYEVRSYLIPVLITILAEVLLVVALIFAFIEYNGGLLRSSVVLMQWVAELAAAHR